MHLGWGQCEHGLSSRPRESCDLHILTPLLDFFGYSVGAATELFSGTLKLRYSSTLFSKKFPSWPVPDLSCRHSQVPEPEFKSAGVQTFKTSCTEVMNFVTITSELLSPCQSCCNLQHVLPEHRGDRVGVRGGDARTSGASDGRGSVTS